MLNMDPSISSTLLESSMPDIIMRENNNISAVNNNSNLQNGFVHPQDLEPPTAPDFTESSPEDSTQESERVLDDSRVLGERLFWKLPTACCYDDRMKLHANTDWSESQHHPEDPRRIESIMKAFRDAGLIFTGNDDELEKELKKSPTQWMWRIRAREATRAEICLAHTASHYEWTEMLNKKTSAELREMSKDLDQGRKSLYVNSLTFHAALISAGGAIETCKNVVAGYVKNAIAVIRPPGHHAEHNESLGFCIFNNVPIAAKVCMQDYPEKCRKVLILDWDVHHGNGIQNMFYDDPNVLYISLHVYQDGNFYPGQPSVEGIPDGGLRNVGTGPGVGRNINIGWHDQGMGDAEYISAFQQIIMPIAREFDPDLVIISAGFDAAAGDELGGCFVSPECYSHMTHMLMSLADGKVAVCLEGGYNLSAISRSALAVAKTLMGEPPMRMKLTPINKQATLVLNQVKQIHAAYWECLRIGVVPVHEVQQRGGVRLHEVLRAYQKHILLKYRMVSLFVQREKTSRLFKDQILITPLIYAAKKILLIIHDPPDVLATADPIDNKVRPHNAWVTDGVIPYIDWAVSAGYGIVDVNIPSYLPNPLAANDRDAYIPTYLQTANDDPERATKLIESQTKDLMCYLWDNYLDGYGSNSIVLMGVGDAYLGAKQLLINRDCRHKIACIVSFVSGTLRPVKSETDPQLSNWYKNNSLIYVSPDHACWSDPEASKKVRKSRFGGVIKSEVSGLEAMLNRYKVDVGKWVEQKLKDRWVALGLGENGEGVAEGEGDTTEEEVERRPVAAGPRGW